MIERVRIENFRALRNVDVRLKPLTVLIGPNDTGKSSFLDAVYGPQGEGGAGGFNPSVFWRFEDPPRVQLLSSDDRELFVQANMFRLASTGVPMQSEGTSDATPRAPQLWHDGENLAAYLDFLLRKDRRRFDRINEDLRQRVAGFEELSISTPEPHLRRIVLSIERGLEIPAALLSTGVRTLIFFVALAFHPDIQEYVLVEEPENGVHPKRLAEIMGLLRDMTTGRLSGKPTQVILTTHSPYLLDHVHLPEDQVLVFRREDDGSRSVTEVDVERLKLFLDEFMLGEVWFNQGEDGLVPKTS